MENMVQALETVLMDPLTALGHEIASTAPNILAAAVILVAGYFISKLAAFVVVRISEKSKLDSMLEKTGFEKIASGIGKTVSMSEVMGKMAFYILMVTFVMSAAEVLHLAVMADALKAILLYLPNVVATLFVLLFGFYIANVIQQAATESAKGMNIDFAEPLGKTVYGIIAVITVSLGIGQLGIETELLNMAAGILFIAFGAALALSLGLGTKELSAQVIAGSYLRELYRPGEHIAVDEIEGTLVKVGTTKSIIETDAGKEISISNDYLIKTRVVKG